MSIKGLSGLKTLLTVLAVVATTVSLLNIQGLVNLERSGTSGEIVSETWAMTEVLEKDVGETVCFKAKIKNTGNVNTTYLIAAKWCEDETSSWETVGHVEVTLAPGEISEIFIVGNVDCTEEMKGKYFDAKFILYDKETENILDQKELNKAFYVKSAIITGNIYSFWLE